jgi:hypothetical protein
MNAGTKPRSRFCDAVKIVAIFLVVGPPVGALALPLTWVFLFFAIPFSYFLELPAAAFTGLIIAFVSRWVIRPRWLYAIAAVIGGIAAVPSYYTMSLLNKSAYLRIDWRTIVNTRDVLLLMVMGAIAALCCTRLSRRFWLGIETPEPVSSVVAGK